MQRDRTALAKTDQENIFLCDALSDLLLDQFADSSRRLGYACMINLTL